MSTVAVQQALAADIGLRGSLLLNLKEDQWFDRMSGRSHGRQVGDKMIGFANAEGGTIVLGIHGGVIEGVTADRMNEWRQSALDFTTPPVRHTTREIEILDHKRNRKALAAIEVEASEIVHSNPRDEVFLRVGDENRKLKYQEREELLFDKGQATFETRLVTDLTIRDLDQGLLEEYAQAVSHPDAARLLDARGLTKNGQLTSGAVLLFAKDPQVLFPEARIRVLQYGTTERGTGARQQLREEIEVTGPIPRVLLAAREHIRDLVPTRRALGPGGRFQDISLIPEDAWLEGVVNAAIHRSYSLAGDHIRVEIFPDRIEVESPGRAPGLVRLDDPLNSNRFARNPRIARVCADLNFGQELGEGIRRMFDEMRRAGLTDPKYIETPGSVKLILEAIPADPRLDGLRMEYKEIHRLLRGTGPKSSGELAAAMGVSRPTILRWMRDLAAKGIVGWTGASPKDPTAVWRAR